MRNTYIAFILLFTTLKSFAQNFDNIWLFGYDSHLGFPAIEGVVMDFNTAPVSIFYSPRQMSMGSSNASICDSVGNLLFYTNGCYIANANDEILENGEGLNPGEVHNIQCSRGYTAGPQSCLILPLPQTDSIYVLLHKGIVYVSEPVFTVLTDKLYYSTINMSTGTGVVLTKNVLLISDTLDAGQLTAVKHSNGIYWWVIVSEYLSNRYYLLLLTESGLEIYNQQQIGDTTTRQSQAGGQAVFTPDGTKYIRYNPADGGFIFDFDREIGELSNFLHISIDDGAFSGGAAISPNSRYLYIAAEQYLYQFDLQANDIALSKVLIATYDGYLSPFPTSFFQAQLAPDCKIYINSFNTVDVLHVIHYPDEPGLACEVEQHGIQLPFNHRRSMPNFPNYRLGPLVPGAPPAPPCVPVVSVTEQVQLIEAGFDVYPNPASDHLVLRCFGMPEDTESIAVVFDLLGRELLRTSVGARSITVLDTKQINPGIVLVALIADGRRIGIRKVVIQK